jgi:aspartate/methionine/tyrosine aminotransferase
MPRLGRVSSALPESVFARLWPRLEAHAGEVFPFHLGDVHLPPAAPLSATDASFYPYGAPAGDPALLAALGDKLARRNQLHGAVQITCGATHAFACATRALLDPGDEVVLLAPHWPLIRGQILACLATPIECASTDPRAKISPRTAALYVTTPGNPDGRVLAREELETVAAVAREHDLWVLADEVYEDFTFDGREHVSIGSLPGMAERTVTVFSFSKAYGLAGLRVGYLVGPPSLVDPVRKLANHSVFNVPVALQRTALAALESGAPYLAHARGEYQASRDLAHALLTEAGIPFRPAQAPRTSSAISRVTATTRWSGSRARVSSSRRGKPSGRRSAAGRASAPPRSRAIVWPAASTCSRACYGLLHEGHDRILRDVKLQTPRRQFGGQDPGREARSGDHAHPRRPRRLHRARRRREAHLGQTPDGG